MMSYSLDLKLMWSVKSQHKLHYTLPIIFDIYLSIDEWQSNVFDITVVLNKMQLAQLVLFILHAFHSLFSHYFFKQNNSTTQLKIKQQPSQLFPFHLIFPSSEQSSAGLL